MTQKIKPCPVCKTTDYLQIKYGGCWFAVRCHNCGTTGIDGIDKESAIQLWNRLADYGAFMLGRNMLDG